MLCAATTTVQVYFGLCTLSVIFYLFNIKTIYMNSNIYISDALILIDVLASPKYSIYLYLFLIIYIYIYYLLYTNNPKLLSLSVGLLAFITGVVIATKPQYNYVSFFFHASKFKFGLQNGLVTIHPALTYYLYSACTIVFFVCYFNFYCRAFSLTMIYKYSTFTMLIVLSTCLGSA